MMNGLLQRLRIKRLAGMHSPQDSHLPGFVYLAQVGDLYKIGRSKNPTKRLKASSITSKGQVQLIRQIYVPNMDAWETALHTRYSYCKADGIGREYFRLNQIDIDEMLSLPDVVILKPETYLSIDRPFLIARRGIIAPKVNEIDQQANEINQQLEELKMERKKLQRLLDRFDRDLSDM